MAAPATRTIGDLTGVWMMNKSISDDTDPALSLQGIGWLVRKTVGLASITLHIKQHKAAPSPPSTATEPVVHVDIEQVGTGGLKGTTEHRCVDGLFREHSDWMFGSVRGKSTFVDIDEIEEAELKEGFEVTDAEKTGEDGKPFLKSYVESLTNGWIATQIWGFKILNGERRYCRNILITKGDKKVLLRLVYDYVREADP